jgi:hypothetical protein
MGFRLNDGRFLARFGFLGFMLAVAGCQSGDSTSVLGVGDSGDSTPKTAPEGKVLQSELRAYCPPVTLREGTAFFNSYEKKGDADPTKLIYQSSISAVTRTCSYSGGMITMNIAVAGKVVPGPVATDSTVAMPIRIVVSDASGGEPLYSQLHKYEVTVNKASGATQFVFNDPNVTFAQPAPGTVQVFAGYDEGPPKKGEKVADDGSGL